MRTWIVLAATLAVAGCSKKAENAPEPNAPPPSAPVTQSGETTPTDESSEPETKIELPAGGAPTPTQGEDKNALHDQEYKTLAEAESALSNAKHELDQLLKTSGSATPLSVGDSRCDGACKALSSMKRAADAVCRLAGDSDQRCKKARTLVEESEGRVATCKCG